MIRIHNFFGSDLHVNPKNDVGFFGGIKLGYVFGHGLVRPTIEGDFFYNGFRGGADFTLNEAFSPSGARFRTAQRNVTTWINTGAWLANFILRFAPGNQKFQPYLGAGVGIYYAESAGVQVNDPVTGAVPINTGGGASHADLACDALPVQITFSPQVERVYRISIPQLSEHPTQYPAKSRSGPTVGRRGCPILFSYNAGNLSLV